MKKDLPRTLSLTSALPQHARQVLRILGQLYPDAHCTLNHNTPLQLLIATILSAQSTDARVNIITPALFVRYPDVKALASARPRELEDYIHSIGFYRNKAKNIIACCKQLIDKHGGEVPATLEELVSLPGVGRKTANVLLGDAFGVPGITVDTHVSRLSQRLGLTAQQLPEKIERDLMELIPKKQWTTFSHRMIFHGRQVCHARRPLCESCALQKICPKIGIATAASGLKKNTQDRD